MKILASTAVAMTLASGAAQAAVFDASLTVNSVTGERANLWFSTLFEGAGVSAFLLNESGVFETFDDGTSLLTATAFALDDATTGFDLSFSFTDDVPIGSVYKDVFGRFGGIAPDNLELLSITEAQLSGFGDLESLVLDAIQFPADDGAVTQTGGGTIGGGTANQHNENFGLSSWFAIDNVSFDPGDCILCDNLSTTLVGSQGDIVFDLTPAIVPLPAGVLFSLTGLAALGFARRRS